MRGSQMRTQKDTLNELNFEAYERNFINSNRKQTTWTAHHPQKMKLFLRTVNTRTVLNNGQ